jgi:hypothetical protein
MRLPKAGDGIVIRMLVRRQVPERHVSRKSRVPASANSPSPDSSRTTALAPSSPDGKPPSLVHPDVCTRRGSVTDPTDPSRRRRTVPDASPAANPAAREEAVEAGPGCKCGTAYSCNQPSQCWNIFQ